MHDTTVKKEIIDEVGRLDYEQQRRVLDFARALIITDPKGVSGKRLLSFAGTIPAGDLKKMKQAIDEDFWKTDAAWRTT